jgi:hypothetical protein
MATGECTSPFKHRRSPPQLHLERSSYDASVSDLSDDEDDIQTLDDYKYESITPYQTRLLEFQEDEGNACASPPHPHMKRSPYDLSEFAITEREQFEGDEPKGFHLRGPRYDGVSRKAHDRQ